MTSSLPAGAGAIDFHGRVRGMRSTLLLGLLFASCQCGVPVATGDGGANAGGTATGGGAATGGGTTNGGGTGGGSGADLDAGLMDFCNGNAPVPVTVGGSTICSGDLGKRTFTFAFCSCQGVTANNQFRVGAISGARDGGGSIGVNGPFVGSNNTVIGGTIWASGDVTSSNNLTVGRDVVCGQNVSVATGAVGRDVVVVGNANASGAFRVGGAVRTSQASMVSGFTSAGGVVRGTPMVAAPCDCSSPVDVGAIVTFFSGVSDNAARGVSPTALTGTANTTLTLECGRYLFQGITSTGITRVRTRGRVVIAIDGDVTTSNSFELVPEAGSQVDVFIRGNLTLSNNASVGDATRPFATRVYVGGTQVTASNSLSVSANLYAGRAAFSANNTFDMRGALFVGSLAAANSFTVNYDDAILGLDGCAPSDAGCSSCRQCANPTPACRGGSCGHCQTDADCCPPLSCEPVSGHCVEGIIQ